MVDAFIRIFTELLDWALEISSNVADLFFSVSSIGSGSFLDIWKLNSLLFHEIQEIFS